MGGESIWSTEIARSQRAENETVNPSWATGAFVYGVVVIVITALVFSEEDNLDLPTCHTLLCNLASQEIARTQNRFLGPCRNFFEFVCDDWAHTHRDDESVLGSAVVKVCSEVNNEALKVKIPFNGHTASELAMRFY